MDWRGKRRSGGLLSAAINRRSGQERPASSPERRRPRFEALEDRRMLAAAGQSDNCDDVLPDPLLFADYPAPEIIRVDEASSTAEIYQPDELALVSYAPDVSASLGIVNANSLTSEQPAAIITVPRGRPTLNATGTTFVADNGSLLRGPFASTEWGNPPPLSAIQSIKDLGANAIHHYGEVFDPNYVSGVPGSGTAPGYAASRIDQMVQMTRDEGLYLVLTIGNGGNNGSFNYDYVMDFWSFYADRYKNETHVIYEIQNEPHAWSAPYPQAALNMEADAYTLIRSLAPDAPILLFSFAVLGSGPAAVSDIAEVSAATSIDWTNAGVAFHGYAGHEATTTSVEYILNAGYPVFMTEFTASDWGTDVDVLDVELVAELERLEVSWLTFQHIPPNFIGTAYTDPTALYGVVNKAGLYWEPDFGSWPVERGIYGNGGQPRATTGLTGTLRIEAEHFDVGAQGVSYSDTDSVNQGGQLRLGDGVDIEVTTDLGQGHHVSSTASGEWLEFTIFVTEPGLHDLRLRVASPSEGAAQIFLNGEAKTSDWLLPSSGGSQSWTTVTKQVFLEYGRQKLRFEIKDGGFNLNWIELAPITSGPISNGQYKILNRNSALILEADTANQRVVQSPYTGATNERWNLVHRGAGQYSITSVSNGWSWNTFYDNNGEPLMLAPWGYDGHPDRRFIVAPETDGFFRILVVDGGLGIEIGDASLTSGAQAQQQEYQEDGHQQWAVLTPSAPSFPTGLTADWGDVTEVPGDYNSDGEVSGADFLVWQLNIGTTFSGADGDGNGLVDGGDLEVWSNSYGHGLGSAWAQLSWNAVPGAVSYNVKRATTSGGPYVTIATGVTGTTYSDTGLAAGNTYNYVVSAVSLIGESLISAEASPPLLHAHFKFDETSGTTAADATGNGWTGTLVDGPLWAMGINDNALDLDGTNDYVSLPTGVVNDLTEATLATWVRLDSLANWARLFDFGTGTTTNMFLAPQSGITGLPVFAITTTGNGGEQRINSSAAIATGTWTHLAVTFNGSTGILYLNGVEVGRNNSMTLSPSLLGVTTQNYVGKSQYTWDPYLNGRVDDFRIYDNALSAAEVAALAAAPVVSAAARLATVATSSPIGQSLDSGSVAAMDVKRAVSYSQALANSEQSARAERSVETRDFGPGFDDNRAQGVARDGQRPYSWPPVVANQVAARASSIASTTLEAKHYDDRMASHRARVDQAMAEFEYESTREFQCWQTDLFDSDVRER